MKGGGCTKATGKKSVVLIAVLLLAVIVGPTLALIWTEASVKMHASTGEVVSLALYSDINATTPITDIDWGPLAQGETYTAIVYAKNTGNKALLLYYSSRDYSFYGNSHFILTVNLATILGTAATTQLFEKDTGIGYALAPKATQGLVLKLYVETLASGGTYDFDFKVYGVTQE